MTTHDELIFLQPVLHNNIWGGHRLAEEWGYDAPEGKVGECWGISAHPHGDCTVAGGPYDGKHLSELWDTHRELFGNAAGDRFPLLIKVLDAHDDLSIQVHPDDAYATEHENGSLGKHECWYVLDAHPHAHIIVGQHAHDRAEFAQMVEESRWDDLVNLVPIKSHDFFDIKPGTVHAIMAGTLLIETQQSSDVTYRVYDYDRPQADGTLRELHLDRAMDVIDYNAQAPLTGEVMTPETDGITPLLSCKYFDVLRIRSYAEAPTTVTQDHPFLCVSVVEGAGQVSTPAGTWELRRGAHLVAPANSGDLTFSGDLTAIASFAHC